MGQKLKRPFNKYLLIAIIGIVLWVSETAYFGFNQNAESGQEGLADAVALILIGWGIIGDLLKNLHIHKHYEGDHFNSKNFKYIDKRTDGKNVVKVTTTEGE